MAMSMTDDAREETLTQQADDAYNKSQEANEKNRDRIGSSESDDERAEQLSYERRQARKKSKKNESWLTRLGNKIGGRDDGDKGKKAGWLMEDLPGYFLPSFVEHNGYVMSLVELYASKGTNRNLTYADVIELIPVDAFKNVEMFFMVDDTYIKGDEKKRLIQQNARSGKQVIDDTQQHGPDEDRDNANVQRGQSADIDDFNHYESTLDVSSDPIVAYRITLAVIGHDRETVEDQIQVLNTLLDQRHSGAKWDSIGGDQHHRFTHMFTRLYPDRFMHTSTGDNYAGLNFAVSAGLNDAHGLPVGRDALSLTGATSFFDMSGTLSKQSIISIPRRSTMDLYTRRAGGDNDNPEATPLNTQPSASSIFAQYASNQIMLDGYRAHHLVMNDFDYVNERGLYYRKANVPGVFESYDVSKVTINPMEGFGDVEDVVQVFGRLTNKLVNIFDVLNDLSLSSGDGHQRGVLLDAIRSFYERKRYWVPDADKYPLRTNIVNISNPRSYSTITSMLNEFTTMANAASKANKVDKARDIETLKSILEQAVSSHRAILGRPTAITPSKAKQVYYDFSSIESIQVRQVQLLNMIDYVTWTADEGDVIVLHGIDTLWSAVMSMLQPSIDAAQQKGIRFIFASDVVANHKKSAIPVTDMFDMQGVFYTDLDTDVDWSVVGTCLPNEVDMYERALSSRLSETIRGELVRKARCKVLIHRRSGDINTFVHANAYI